MPANHAGWSHAPTAFPCRSLITRLSAPGAIRQSSAPMFRTTMVATGRAPAVAAYTPSGLVWRGVGRRMSIATLLVLWVQRRMREATSIVPSIDDVAVVPPIDDAAVGSGVVGDRPPETRATNALATTSAAAPPP